LPRSPLYKKIIARASKEEIIHTVGTGFAGFERIR
jgi:hypothetical protein